MEGESAADDSVWEVVEPHSVVRAKLEAAVADSTDGKAVLHYYKTHSCLNNKMRQRLANLIIDNELKSDPNRIILHRNFQALAHAIADVFPPEKSESYFTPYCSDARGKRYNAKGKLLDRYKNMRKAFRACGLIEKKQTVLAKPKNNSTSLFSGRIGEEIKWLTKNMTPWSKVENYWSNTADKRLEHLYNDLNSSVDLFMDLFPALKEPEGHRLINIDFGVKYPDAQHAFFDSWDTFTEKILDFSQNKFENDIKFRMIIQAADIDINITGETARKVTAFYLLSYLMPKYQTCKTNSGPPWRPTRDEMKNGLLLNVKTPDEMDEALEKRKNIYMDCNLPLTPIPIIVGSPDNVTSSFVNFNSFNYELSSPMAAIDLCYKMHQIFNLSFSPETMYVWLFVERYVYNLKNASGTSYIPITTLATDLFV